MYKNKKIVLVIPVFNEEQHIGEVIDQTPDYVDEIVVVDDGSIDNTTAICKGKGVIVVSHHRNRGVGVALRTGINKVLVMGVDIMVNMDGDGQFNPRDIPLLIDPIIDHEADFVTASRFLDKQLYPKMSKVKFWGNKLMSFIISKITGQKFFDVSCGFRAYSKETLLRLNLFGDFTYTQETFIDLAFKGLVLKEVPFKVKGKRKYGKSRVAANLFKYGYNTFKVIFRAFRDYRPLKLFFLFTLFFFLLSMLLGGFLLIHYLNKGMFFPHKWAGFVSGFLLMLSLLMFFIGVILDMFARMRHNQEEMLYLLRKGNYFNNNKGNT